MLEAKYLIDAAIDALDRCTPVIGFFPLGNVSGNRREIAAIKPNDSVILWISATDRND